MDVVGFGALNVDEIISIDKIIPGQETYGKIEGISGGGSAANTCIALYKMGFDVGYIGAVGTDVYGGYLLKSLEGVDKSKVRRCKGPSGRALSQITHDGERTICVIPGVNDELNLSNEDIAYSNRAKYLHLTSFVGEDSLRAQKDLVENTEASISFDPGAIYAKKGNKLYTILENTYVLFLNEEELRMLNPKDGYDYKRLVKDLSEEFEIPIVVCKRGPEGCYGFARRNVFGKECEAEIKHQPLPLEQVVDTTGAGDVFDAGFLAYLLKSSEFVDRGKTLSEALFFADTVAKESIKGIGREKYPDKGMAEKYLGSVKNDI